MAFDDSKFVTGDEVASIVVSKFTGDRGEIDTLHRSVPNQTDRIMDLLTQTHLTTLRDLLTQRLLELRAEVNTAEQAQRESTGAGTHEVADRKDEAAQQQFSDLGGAQEQRDVDEIAQVEAALHRLDGGIYGDCADCAEPISLQRLLVLPAAQRCAPCQTAYEHALDRSSPRGAS